MQNDPAVKGNIAIEGLTTVSSRGQTTYQAVVNLRGAKVAIWRWNVQGHAAIVGPVNGPTVNVNITGPEGGGEFTLSLTAALAKGQFAYARRFKVKVSPYPQFRVVVHNAVNGTLNPTDLTGSGNMIASQEYVEYQYWSLYFVGDISTFPEKINVYVGAGGYCPYCVSNWANGHNTVIYLDFPKQGGGTVGVGGTVYNPGANRPYLCTPSGQRNGLNLMADGVQYMDLKVKR